MCQRNKCNGKNIEHRSQVSLGPPSLSLTAKPKAGGEGSSAHPAALALPFRPDKADCSSASRQRPGPHTGESCLFQDFFAGKENSDEMSAGPQSQVCEVPLTEL